MMCLYQNTELTFVSLHFQEISQELMFAKSIGNE